MARKNTNRLLEMIEEGVVDRDTVIIACLKFMSEQEVTDMMEINGFDIEEEEQNENNEIH